MSGLSSTGFQKKVLTDIKTELENELKQAFGAGINLSAGSVFATLVGILAEREASVWDLAESVYNSQFPDTASGVNLDNVAALTGTSRLGATNSIINSQLLFGVAGTSVPAGTVFSAQGNPNARFKTDGTVVLGAGADEIQHIAFNSVPTGGTWSITWNGLTTSALAFNANAAAVQAALRLLAGLSSIVVTGDYTAGFDVTYAGVLGKQDQPALTVTNGLTGSGTITVTVTTPTPGLPQGVATMTAESSGAKAAPTGSLTVIETPVTGLASTSNTVDAVLGRDVETDAELRLRRISEIQKPGLGTLEAIRSRLKEVANVKEAIVFENTTMTTDGSGRPAKSIEAFVDGGADADIGLKLWQSKPAGIQTYGTVTQVITDTQGVSQTMHFSRPVEKNVYVDLTITKDATFPTDGITQVKNLILAYAALLQIGEDVLVYPRLLPSFADDVAGVLDIVIKVGFSASPTLSSNLVIAANEIAKFDSSRITVTLV